MIISDKKKFVFIHNPKTAGTSLREALKEYHDRDSSYWHHLEDIYLDRVIDKAHITMRDFVYMPDYSSIDEYFSFGFVRNPYDRFYSAFQFYKKQYDVSIGFNDFSKTLNDISIRYDWRLIHFCPQYAFFYYGNKCKIDFIGRFENIKTDVLLVSSIIGVDIDIGKSNVSDNNKPIYIDNYNESTIRIVNKLYEKDFALFHYQKIIPNGTNNYIENHKDSVYESVILTKSHKPYDQIDILLKINKEQKISLDYHTPKSIRLDAIYKSSFWKAAKPVRFFYNLFTKL